MHSWTAERYDRDGYTGLMKTETGSAISCTVAWSKSQFLSGACPRFHHPTVTPLHFQFIQTLNLGQRAVPPLDEDDRPDCRYLRLSDYLRRRFGGRVWKVSVDAGLGCPNRDGTVGRGGCVFCDPVSFSPSRRGERGPIAEQVQRGAARLRQRRGAEQFIAYFQPATNTYGPPERLREAYREALGVEGVVGLAVGTRPDCLGDRVLDLLADIARSTWVSVEIGLQSIHPASLAWMNRGHDARCFFEAVDRCHRRGLRTVAHVILGLPGEGAAEIRATADELARLRIDGVKMHNLHVVRGTPLAEMYSAGQIKMATLDDYAKWAADFIERLHPECVIERLAADAPADHQIAPAWCRDRSAARRAIEAELRKRDTRQGGASQRP